MADNALDRLIRRREVAIAFQPIVDLRSGDSIGVEALLRPRDTSVFPHVGALFEAATEAGRLGDLEAVARHSAFETFFGSGRTALLFMNNSPVVMSEAGFVDSITDSMERIANFDPTRIVLEITERAGFSDFDRLRDQSVRLREMGFQTALDDVGAGLSGLNRIMSLRPDWVKLDRELIANVDQEPLQENLIRSLLHFARLSNMALIAEGIERFEELRALVEMGVGCGQGFFLSRPHPDATDVPEKVKRSLAVLQTRIAARCRTDATTVRIGTLARPVATFDINLSAGQAAAQLAEPAEGTWAVALDGRRYRGLIEIPAIIRAVDAGRGQVPLFEIPRRDGCLLGADTSLAEALELAASRPDDELAQPVVVQENGHVLGTVSLRQLLRSSADVHRLSPSRVAGLTGIPTAVEANEWIADRIRARDPYDFAYVDLRDFDAYNVAFGFEKGDAMLLDLVDLLRRVVAHSTPGDSLLAHLGEDRFLIAYRGDFRPQLEQLITDFRALRAEAFTSADRAEGTFACVDAAGQQRRFPLTSVRVIYLVRPLLDAMTPESLHETARSMRLSDHPAGPDEILVDRRKRGAACRHTA